MPYEYITVKGVITGLAGALSALALWVVQSLVHRIAALEDDMEMIKKEKLDRSDYIREHETLKESIREDFKDIRDKLSNLPNQIVAILKDTGRI